MINIDPALLPLASRIAELADHLAHDTMTDDALDDLALDIAAMTRTLPDESLLDLAQCEPLPISLLATDDAQNLILASTALIACLP